MKPMLNQEKFLSTFAILSILTVMFGFFQNCSKTQLGNPENNNNNGNENQIATVPLAGNQLIDVVNATDSQCPSGGKVYSVYTDINKNHSLDDDDVILSSQTVCNGAAGANGNDGSNAMISMNRVVVGLEACSGNSGIQLSAGTDVNKNNSLDASEISSTEVLCDGADGTPGANGAAGTNGHSAVFSIVSAPAAVCAQGGSIIMMAIDIHDRGYYSDDLPNQQSATICNGANGMNAQPSPYQIVDMIKPCGETVANKEVLIRLQNGQLLASVSDNVSGYNTRLALVVDGNYVNTDPSACTFSIATQNKIRSISWRGAVQLSWPMP